jgi:protease-4
VLAPLVRLIVNLGSALRDALLAPFETRLARSWVAIRLDRGLVEASSGLPWLDARPDAPRLLRHVLTCMERAASDPAVRGVLIRIGMPGLGWAKVAALARGVAELQKSGKQVVVYAEATGNAGAWLGALADCFWMTPAGRVDLIGVRIESPFVRSLLDRLGIVPEVLQAGRYKTAGEMLTREGLSEASREALDAVVEDYYSALVDGIAEGRGVDAGTARRWIDGGPYRAAEARELGLVDDLLYADELPARLAELVGDDPESPKTGIVVDRTYLRLARRRFRWRPLWDGPRRVAVVSLTGAIRARQASPRGVVGALRRLARDDSVRAVVLRIDSPGGDALASDLIWRGVRQLADRKPVVASLGDTAASGGYYAAMAAQEIVAEPTTLTGSIGVVMASVDVSQLLEKLGVRFDGVARGEHAGIFASTRPRSRAERALLRRQVERTYDEFLTKAAEGRGLSREALHEVAQGRVWTGRQASERGLVDHLGGLATALGRARALAGLDEAEAETVFVPSQISPLQRLLRGDPLEAAAFGDGAQFWCPVRVPLR